MDDLDSKMESVRAHFEREAESEGPWTSYNASLGRPLLNSGKFLIQKANPPLEAAIAEPSPVAEEENAAELPEEAPTLPGFAS